MVTGTVRNEAWSVDRKKPGRKAEPASKRRIAWPRWTGFRGMTLREWLQLLIVPFALVVISFVFTMQQDARQQAIEDKRAEAERDLAEQRAQDEALQAYLDQMSNLLLEKNLRESEEDSEVRTLARARTLTVLGRLDTSRKTEVMRFLSEADLVGSVDGRDPVIGLMDADLSGADLSGANTSDGDLSEANLSGADLIRADLSGADLSGADLISADLHEADLSRASLPVADLTVADLSGANLYDAYLYEVKLSGADLSRANLYSAAVTQEQLDQARFLEGVIMPDGTINAERYATREFKPTLSFNISDDCRLAAPETTDGLFITGPEGGQLNFTSPLHVFDPTNLSEPNEVPAPESADEWVSWFQRYPNLTPRTGITTVWWTLFRYATATSLVPRSS
jgi:uncharacterized protein YjbI with pentapeptide repeats